MTAPVQTSMLGLYPCPTCQGTGRKWDPELDEETVCRTCAGAKNVSWDPADKTIPF